MSVAVLFTLFFAIMLIGSPIAIALGASTFATLVFFTDISPLEISSMMFAKLEHYSLMAIPMFILAGQLLSKGSSAARIIDFAKSIVGTPSWGSSNRCLFLLQLSLRSIW